MLLPLADGASWRLATELCRRRPSLFIRETHPGGGQYDCLTLTDPELGHICDINRVGRFHVFKRVDGVVRAQEPWDAWGDLRTTDCRHLVDHASRIIGQNVPDALPASTSRVLAYRTITEIVSSRIFARRTWSCRNGVHDSSAGDGGVRDVVNQFPGPRHALAGLDDAARLQTAYTFWFILRDGAAVACVCEDGRGWTRSGQLLNLLSLYAKHKRLTPIVLLLVGDLLD